MKVFFQANSEVSEELKKYYQEIFAILENNGVAFFSNLKPERAEKAGLFIFNQIDAVIIEGTKLNSESAYILALALSQKKPILYLVAKGTALDEEVKKLADDKKISKYFSFHYYHEKSLKKYLTDFIESIGAVGSFKELAAVKFTLRLTPRIERYLAWKIANTKMSKADYMRVLLSKLMEEDDQYKKFLKVGEE